jgi:wobble nucleotide-excising tRNase
LELNINKGITPTISSSLPLIFHVFNSDYVHDNIEDLGYKPDGNIEGYILSKVQIDLTKEKKELDEKNETLKTKKQEFELRVNTQKIILDDKDLAINKGTTEYKNFKIENIFSKNDFGYSESKSFEELKKENTILNTLPDDLPNVAVNNANVVTDFFDNLEQTLKHSYSKSHFAEEFKTKIKSKQGFIESGLKITTENKCPFCEQTFDQNALELIDTYTKYLADEEAKIISQIDTFIKRVDEVKQQIDNNYKNSLKSKTDFDDVKKYLPSFKEQNIELLQDSGSLENDFIAIVSILNDTKNDISKELSIEVHIKNIEAFKKTNSDMAIKNNKNIDELNKAKNNTNNEKLNIKKRLCKAQYLKTLQSEIKNIDEIVALQKEIQNLEKDISDKENQAKALKKDKVIEAFEEFLNVFFAGKYTFDKDNFCLKFDTHNLISNASDVLSDGEKSIVAFCFFLAETHKKINKKDDYKKLFFVIDDPISSLDFHYVYSVAQIIRRLNDDSRFPIGDKLRFLVLTHNIEFMSILIRNRIVNGQFILEKSEIKKLQKELIMPYEEHLRDIYEVSEGTKTPSHTIPNLIRHILETINKFEKPNLDFITYCENIELLKDDNEFLYALIHDNSHGNYRNQMATTPDMIIKGCKKVIEVISSKFDGQIEVMKKNL